MKLCHVTVQISHFGRADGPGDAVFRSPLSVTCDVTSGRMFAADADTGCVKIFDARCKHLAEFGNTSDKSSSLTGSGKISAILDRPLGLCCDSRGNIVVCDSGNHRVVLFSPDGRYLSTLIDFRLDPGTPIRWRLKRRPQNGHGTLVPVCVGLSSPGSRIAIGLNDSGARSPHFRKLVVCSVTPEL